MPPPEQQIAHFCVPLSSGPEAASGTYDSVGVRGGHVPSPAPLTLQLLLTCHSCPFTVGAGG